VAEEPLRPSDREVVKRYITVIQTAQVEVEDEQHLADIVNDLHNGMPLDLYGPFPTVSVEVSGGSDDR